MNRTWLLSFELEMSRCCISTKILKFSIVVTRYELLAIVGLFECEVVDSFVRGTLQICAFQAYGRTVLERVVVCSGCGQIRFPFVGIEYGWLNHSLGVIAASVH